MKLRRMMVSFLLLAALVGICVPVTVRADCSHSYENGFCTACGGYEEAVLNGDVYEISNAGQLYWFSELVTSGQTAVNGKLTQDIVVNEDLLSKIVVANDGTVTVRGDYTLREWLPIGSEDAKFEGTFDGNGKSIFGLYFDHQEATVALFRYIASGGTVKNVRILASCLAGGGTRGGIVDTNEGTVDNCSYAGYIGCSNSSSGGIVYANRGTVVNCENEAIVRGVGYAGGIAGENLGKLENCRNIGETYGRSYVGGIAGLNGTNGEIISCLNTDWVSADSTTGSNNNVGGIVGSNSGTISQCGNSGQIALLYGNIGGIVGWNGGAVTDCYNTGEIDSGYDNAGGIIGYHGSGASAVNCCNTGAVRPMACLYDWNGKYFGAIIGRNQNGTVTNCHYLKNSAQDRYNIYQQGIGCGTMGDYTPDISGKTTVKTSTQLASGEVTWLLNGSTSEGDLIWHQDIGTDAAPQFEGGVVYRNQTRDCKSSNYTYSYANEQLAAVVTHKEVTDAATEATCTETGLTEGVHCSACGEVLTAQEEIPALGHTEVTDAAVEATCTADGLTEGVHCSACGEVLTAQEEIPALGHTEVTDAAVEATCTADGLTEGKHCSACGEVLTAQETIPAPGHKDEVKDHNCDSCGEKLSDCAESVLHYYDQAIPVSAIDAANLKNSSYIRVIGVEEIFRRVDNIAQIAVDANVLDGIIESEDFRTYAAEVLGVDIGSLNDKVWELAENLANTSGISLEEAVTELSRNMAAMYASHSAVAMDKAEITAFLTDPGSREILSDNLRHEESQNLGFTQAVLVYGMYTAYAYTREEDSLIANLDSLSIVLNAFDDLAFLEYTAGEQGGIDLNGYLSALNMIRECAENDAAAMELLAAGFNDGELKEAVQTMLDELDHTCDICGKVLSECQWGDSVVTSEPTCTQDGVKTYVCTICGAADTETVPATGHTEVTDETVEATCTETGLTEGSHCSVCKAVLVAQEVVPTVGHSYTEAVTAPTCLEKGYTTYSCTCGDSYVGDYTDIVDHSFVNGICQFCDLYEPAPDENDDGVFEIYNAGNLYWLAELINGDEIAMNAILMNDITVNENVLNSDGTLNGDGSSFRSWVPIGKNSNVAYIGTFDGSGYTISGLYVNGGNAIGLIGYLGSKGVVRDLTVADSWFSGGSQLGAVAGCSYGSVMNCTSTAAVSGTNYVGGIVGEGTAQDCRNQGAVNGEAYVGGIVGYGTARNSTNNGAITGEDRTGGIIGKGNAYGCVNSGTVSGKTSTGGIVGHISSETISLCANAGTVTGTEYVGGIVGKNYGTVTDCYNTGSISGTRYVSGIAGLIQEAGYSNYGTVANCYNTGTLSGNTNGRCIVGHNYAKGIITNCYYQAYSEKDDMEGTTYKSQLRFKTGEVTWLLNGSTSEGELVWYQDIGTDQMPQFEGGVVYRNQTGGCNEETYTYAYVNEYKEPVFAHKDEDADNKCDACGELLRFDISYASMTMGNSLAMNFAFAKNAAADWTGYYAVIEKDYADGRENAVQTVPFADWKTAGIGGVAHYYVTFNGIAAKEMMDNVYVTIYNADAEAVSDTWTDSVCAQAMRNLAKDTISAEEKTMVVDMLNYGAAAQQEFQYNTADLATALLSEEQKALATEGTTYEDAHVGTGNYVASNLMLKSNIQLMFAFRNVTSDMKAVVTFTNHRGVAKNITIEGTEFTKNGSLSVVTVEDMVVADSRQDITCTIYDGETVVAAITDSVESYATRKSNTLFEMLMRFSDSAYAYFH